MSVEPLIEQLVADAGPVRLVRPVRVRLVRWIAATVLFLVPLSLLLRMRPDLTEMLARPAFLWSAAALALAAALAAAAALVLSVPGAERTIAQRAAPLFCAGFWPVLLLVSPAGSTASAATAAGVCALLIAAIAAGPGWLLHRYVREGASVSPAWSTGLAMLAAGCAAALAQQTHCPTDAPAHLISEHVLAVAALAGGAALAATVRRRP